MPVNIPEIYGSLDEPVDFDVFMQLCFTALHSFSDKFFSCVIEIPFLYWVFFTFVFLLVAYSFFRWIL